MDPRCKIDPGLKCGLMNKQTNSIIEKLKLNYLNKTYIMYFLYANRNRLSAYNLHKDDSLLFFKLYQDYFSIVLHI